MRTFITAFSLESKSADGALVAREGKVFELGNWPDKQFELSEAEADAAIAAFTPTNNDLEHRETILSGKLGTLDSLKRIGNDIIGRVLLPKWLDDLQGETPLKVSLAWDSAKRVVGNALTLNPRITDAQVVASFTADSDMAIKDAFAFFTAFAGKRHSATDSTDLQAVHELVVKLGAECKKDAPTPPSVTAKYNDGKTPTPKEKVKTMTLRDIAAKFGFGANPDLDAEMPAIPIPVVPAVVPIPAAASAFSAEAESLKSEIKVIREANLTNAAKAFCAELRTAKKIVPAQEPAIIAAFCQNATDDAVGQAGFMEGVACFSDKGILFEGSRVKTLRDQYTAAPPLHFTEELLDSTDQTVLFGNGGEAPMTPNRAKALLGATPLGQAAMAAAKGAK